MKKVKKVAALFMAVIMVLGLTACGQVANKTEADATKEETEIIKVGYVNDLTGDGAAWGIPGMRGVEMAVEEINSKGGVLGKQIKLFIEDGQGDPQDSVAAFNKLISEGCVAVIGTTTSGPNIAMASVADSEKIPLIGLGCTNDLVTVDENGKLHPYSFRLTCIDSYMAYQLAEYMIDKGYDTVGIFINQGDAYSVGTAEKFMERYTERGGKIVAEENGYDSDVDFRAQLTKIKEANPKAFLFPWAYTSAAIIAQQARDLGLEMQYVGTDGWDVFELASMANGALEGAFYLAKPFLKNEESLQLRDKYMEKYPEETEFGNEALLGWDAVNWLVKAINETQSTDAEAIRSYLETTKNYNGLIGEFSVDENHNLMTELCINEIKDNERILKEYIEVD